MPTAAKLFAAIAFALLGFFVAQVAEPALPAGMRFGSFWLGMMLLGLICGWRVAGPTAGAGNLEAINSGVRTALVMAVLSLIFFSTIHMFVESSRGYYRAPMDAVVGIFGNVIDMAMSLMVWDVLIVLLVGGALAGLLSEWAGRRWS